LEIGFENGDIKSRGKVAATRIPAAALTALLFGFHPLHVESVAWATERKDVLCAFFYLLALLLYLNYAFGGKQRNLFLCFCFFILALMSKPMAITLPMVLLILDLWPLRRLEIGFLKILKEKILFYIAAFLTGAVALLSPHPAVEAIGNPSLVFRLANSFRSVIFYMMKIVFPMRLSPLYPFPINQTEAYKIENCLAALAVLLLTAGLFWYRHKTPYLLIGWLYFLITLSPVLGIFQLGFHAAADRYTYLPSLGLLLPAAVVISALLAQRKQVFFLFCAGLALLLGFLTVQQIGVWENSETLWKTVLARYPEDSPAFVHENLGAVYQTQGRLGDALREYERAIALSPFSEPAHNGKGTIFFDMGRQQEAVQEFKLSISLEPLEAPPHRNLAIAYERMGMHEQALSEMQIAEKIKAENPE
jgi:tetratricopeptide (TPR) repeat protein